MRNLAAFSLGSVLRKLNRIRIRVHEKHYRPFPKPEIFWLSNYSYQHRYIRIENGGRIQGGLSRFVCSLIDFSFVRSLTADRYGIVGIAYDPVSLFLVQLFCYLGKYPDMKTFLETLRDKEKGKHYRIYGVLSATLRQFKTPKLARSRYWLARLSFDQPSFAA